MIVDLGQTDAAGFLAEKRRMSEALQREKGYMRPASFAPTMAPHFLAEPPSKQEAPGGGGRLLTYVALAGVLYFSMR